MTSSGEIDPVGKGLVTVYREPDSDTGHGTWTITSSPVPLVSVTLFFRGGFYWYSDDRVILGATRRVDKVRELRTDKRRQEYLETALAAAGDFVTRMARLRFKKHFTNAQRYAMGQQQCPKNLGTAGLCRQRPAMGSVWCSWHPMGKAVK